MNRTLKTLLLMACKEAGTYDPDEVLPRIEEQLTGPEYDSANGFLAWVMKDEDNRHFGHGNIDTVFGQWLKAKAEEAKP